MYTKNTKKGTTVASALAHLNATNASLCNKHITTIIIIARTTPLVVLPSIGVRGVDSDSRERPNARGAKVDVGQIGKHLINVLLGSRTSDESTAPRESSMIMPSIASPSPAIGNTTMRRSRMRNSEPESTSRTVNVDLLATWNRGAEIQRAGRSGDEVGPETPGAGFDVGGTVFVRGFADPDAVVGGCEAFAVDLVVG